jgi:hypothetical protein
MPHFLNTPEALIGRNDSKNPATTCKGITSSGRPCRRALASPKGSPIARRKANKSALGGVVALVHEDGELDQADFYCWQHKDQVEQLLEDNGATTRPNKRRSTELYPLKERSSIDTMVQKLGLDPTEDSKRHSTKPTKNPKPPRRTQTTDFAAQHSVSQAPYAGKYNLGGSAQPFQTRPKRKSFWSGLCCMRSEDDDYIEIVRHKKRVEQAQMAHQSQDAPLPSQPQRVSATTTQIPSRKPVRPASDQHETASTVSTNPETSGLLSLVPKNLSPSTTSALLAELTKPRSPSDEEGYIYIFWLTPQSKDAPSESTARSLLAPPESSRRPSHGRRISDVMTEYSFDDDDPITSSRSLPQRHQSTKSRTIMFKIGRTSNITRRMNEWQRQCGYALNLVRWYPYVSSSPQPSPKDEVRYPDLTRPPPGRRQSSDTVRKVPCVKRVERLIHIELAEKQAKRQCSACGKEHREWFEVEASQAGIKAVDEVVRRWVGWGDAQG